MGGIESTRLQLSFLQWMVQRSVNARDQVPEEQKESVEQWLSGIGGGDVC